MDLCLTEMRGQGNLELYSRPWKTIVIPTNLLEKRIFVIGTLRIKQLGRNLIYIGMQNRIKLHLLELISVHFTYFYKELSHASAMFAALVCIT